MGYLIRGLLVGFAIAVPVGPIGVLCIRRTLARGRLAGLATGLGAASADAVYGVIAAYGLTLLTDWLVHQQTWLQLVGGIFLCYLGLRTLSRLPTAVPVGVDRSRAMSDFASTFILTLSNPLTIFSFLAVFAGLGLSAKSGGYGSAFSLVLGVFLGSSAWWLFLSSAVALLRDRLGDASLRWAQRVAGVMLLGFGLAALVGWALAWR